MSDHKEPNYMGVWWGLLVLTIAEVAVGYLHFLPRVGMVISLVAMALAKAALVAIYFMHLKFEKKTLATVVLVPLVLSTILFIILVPDGTSPDRIHPPAPAEQPAEGGGEHK
jgi:cytochrome c oxidase subunit 4